MNHPPIEPGGPSAGQYSGGPIMSSTECFIVLAIVALFLFAAFTACQKEYDITESVRRCTLDYFKQHPEAQVTDDSVEGVTRVCRMGL